MSYKERTPTLDYHLIFLLINRSSPHKQESITNEQKKRPKPAEMNLGRNQRTGFGVTRNCRNFCRVSQRGSRLRRPCNVQVCAFAVHLSYGGGSVITQLVNAPADGLSIYRTLRHYYSIIIGLPIASSSLTLCKRGSRSDTGSSSVLLNSMG